MKITINTTDNNANSETEYIYHWDRIGFVLIAIIAICVGLWFGFSKWSEKHGSASLKPPTVASPKTPLVATHIPAEPHIVSEKTNPKPSSSSSSKPTLPEPKIPKADIEPKPVVRNSVVEKVDSAKIEAAKVDAQINEIKTTEPKATKLKPETEKTEPKEQTTHYQQLDFIEKRTQILDESVTRYVLASDVEDKEPVGSLKTLTHRKGGVARVYVFSDVQNFKGETIQYHWYQNDNLLAKVDIEVRGNRWRNKTFQTIGPAMTGTWRVELMFGDITLAKTEFLVKKLKQ